MADFKDIIGSLWLKDSAKGAKYMSGVIKINQVEVNVVVFKNNNKKKENHPDYQIFISEGKKKQNDVKDDCSDSSSIPF